MQDFIFVSPTRFVFGRGVETRVGEDLAERRVRTVLIHYGGGSIVKSGLLDRVKASLDAAQISYVELGGVRPNPEVGLAREGADLCREHKVDLILAVGGGSVIDSAKAIALGVHYKGDLWHFFETKEPAVDVLPLAVILTIPAAGSEASKNTVLSNDELGLKSGYASEALRPKVAYLNPELTFTLPIYQTAAGLVDMYSHLLERFFDSYGAVPVTDNLALSLMKTVRTMAGRIMDNPKDYDARANIMWAGMLCHQGLAGIGRNEDWTTHALEHEISALDTSITHGAGLAVLFPAWMYFVYRENPRRFMLYGSEVFGITPTGDDLADARRAIEATQQFFTSLGMPQRLTQFGITRDMIETLIPTLRINKGEAFGSFKKITLDDARAIYRMAL